MAREVDGRIRTATDLWGDFGFSVATGKIAGVSSRIQYGRNLDVDTSPEDIWAADGVMTYPSSPTTLTVVSDSVNDTSLGTGARSVLVEYLKGDYSTVVVEVEMDSVNPVIVATDFLRIQDAYVKTAGTLRSAAGNISFKYTGGNTVGVIKPTRVDIENTQYTVPEGYTAYLAGGLISAGKSSDATVDFQFRDSLNGGVFRTGQEVIVNESIVQVSLPVYQAIPEKYDVRVQGTSTQGNSSVSVVYYLILTRNDWYANDLTPK